MSRGWPTAPDPPTPQPQPASADAGNSSALDAVFAVSSEGLLLVDGDGAVLRTNRRLVEMWGLPGPPDAVDADAWRQAVRRQALDPDRCLETLARPQASEEGATDRFDLVDGRSIECTIRPVQDGREDPWHVLAFRDVTTQAPAGPEATTPRGLGKTLLETTADGLLAVDLEGNVIAYNDRFAEMWKIPEELLETNDDEALLQHVSGQLVAPTAFLEDVQALYEDEGVESFDTLRFEDGRVFERVSRPHRVDGETVARIWSFRDVTRHKRVQERLRRREEETRELFENLPLGIYQTTPDGRVLMANQALAEMLGYEDPKELLTRNLEEDDEIYQPGYPREIFRKRLEEDGQVEGLATEWTLPDGTSLYVRESARAVYDDDGQVRYYEGTVEDVSQQVWAKNELAISRRRLATVLSEAPVLLVSIGSDGTIDLLEGSGLERFGQEAERLKGRRVHEIGLVNEATREAVDQALAGEPSQSLFELQGRWLQAQFVPSTAAGQVDGVIGVLVDVTERKRVEDQLRDSQQFLESVVSNAPMILSKLTPDGTIRFVTGSALETLGLDVSSLEGSNAFDAYPDNTAHHENLRRALSGERLTETIPLRDRWMQIESVPVLDDQGQVQSVVRVGMDVTARVEAEAEVRRLNEDLERRVRERTAELNAANRELKAFSYSVSHELRGPLQTIDGFSDILLEDHGGDLDPGARRLLDRIRAATQRMDARIDSLLALAHVTRKPLTLQEVDVSDVARRVLSDLGDQDPTREVETRIEENLTVRADPELAEVLLENLLRNAWKFTRDEANPMIEISSDPDIEAPNVVVRDNGIGFDPAHGEELFEPFYRSTDPSFEGDGIGLATVDHIARRHGGSVDATGAPGEGATFQVKLPRG